MALDDIAVWTIPPDWSEGITETPEFLTSVLASPLGTENRFGLRATPRRTFEMTFKMTGPQRTYYDLWIERVGGSTFYMPIWTEVSRLTHAAVVGNRWLTIDDDDWTEFRDVPGIFIRGVDHFDYEIAEFSEVDPNQLLTVDPLARTWPRGTRIYPMQKCRLQDQPSASRKADMTYQVRMRFSVDNPNPTHAAFVFNTYNDIPVLETDPNDIQDLTYTYDRLTAELDNQTGKRARVDLNPFALTTQQHAWYLTNREEQYKFRGLLKALDGRRNPIWVPTFFRDLELLPPFDGTNLVVKRIGYTDLTGPFRGRDHVAVQTGAGARQYREIVSSAIIGDGATEQLTMDSPLDYVRYSNIRRVNFVSLSRLATDSVEIVHHADNRGPATATTVFQSLPRDRVLLEGEPNNTRYFEVQIIAAANGRSVCVGIANSDLTLGAPLGLYVNVDWPLTIGSSFFSSDGHTGHAGWGYPTRLGGGIAATEGQWIGVIVLLDLGWIYFCNASNFTGWLGAVGGGTVDPDIPSGGFPFTDNIDHSPIFPLGGVAWDSTGGPTLASIRLNSVGPFQLPFPIPRSGAAWGSCSWNPGDMAGHITLSSGNHVATNNAPIPGGDQRVDFVRGTRGRTFTP